MNDLKWLKKQSDIKSSEAAQSLAQAGEDFNNEKNNEYEGIAKKNVDKLFFLAIAISLEWGGYARKDEAYYQYATDYLADDNMEALDKASEYTVKGESQVRVVLSAWKKLLKQSGLSPISGKFTLDELVQFQKSLLDEYSRLKVSNRLTHIGPWFLLAPFKILLLMRKDLWNEEKLDQIIMPAGLQVDKAIKLLESKGVKEVSGHKSSLDDKDSNVSLENAQITHRDQEKLAKTLQPKVFHINSGLHLIGQK